MTCTVLSAALENTDNPTDIVHVIRRIQHDRILRKHADALEIATRRSGARGAQARKDLITIEKEVDASKQTLSQSDNDISVDVLQKQTAEAVETLTELESYLGATDSDSAERRAVSILKGLGFKESAINRPYENLSGGWRTRCTLAGALFQKTDILLLDECTNYLDLPAIIWLQSYIQGITDTTVVVM